MTPLFQLILIFFIFADYSQIRPFLRLKQSHIALCFSFDIYINDNTIRIHFCQLLSLFRMLNFSEKNPLHTKSDKYYENKTALKVCNYFL